MRRSILTRLPLAALLLVSLVPGAQAQPAPLTVLKLAETASVKVPPDELAASLRAEAIAATAAEAQAKVNASIADGLARSKQVGGVEFSTGGYSVYRMGPNSSTDKTERWQAGQSLELKCKDGEPLLKLVADLQKSGLAVQSLGWRLSPDAARKARSEATKQALAGLRGRADEAAGQIGLVFDRFQEVRIDSQRPGPIAPRMMSAMAKSDAPSPSAEAEDVVVSATAEADVLLRLKD
jgi:uncharacterized protein YggE